MTAAENAKKVKELLENTVPIGFDSFGFCALSGLPELLSNRLKSEVAKLTDLGGWAIVFTVPFSSGVRFTGNVARYAWPDDYHTVLPEMLKPTVMALREAFPDETFMDTLVDMTPIPERKAAVNAGLGFLGRHGRLITEKWGSEVFICEILTSMELEPIRPVMTVNCGNCGKCISACPTGALKHNDLDPSRCLSNITQKKGELTIWEQNMITRSGKAWGCDICADVCPHNKNLPATPVDRLRENLCPTVTLDTLDEMMPYKSYAWRGREVMERNLSLVDEAESFKD